MNISKKIISDIAKKGKYVFIRQKAVKFLYDPDVLAEIIQNDPSLKVRKTALERSRGQSVSWDKLQKHDRETVLSNVKQLEEVISYEQTLENNPEDSLTAGKLRDLYLEMKLNRHIGQIHDDEIIYTDYAVTSSCCYSDDSNSEHVDTKKYYVQ